MELSFLGAAREVTGSCYLLKVGNKKVLIDCGMEQGPDIYENQSIPVNPSSIDAVLITHAHIDHSGLLPLLYKRGYRNKVFMTRGTKELTKILLLDSAHIQEYEAEWRNRKAKRGSTLPYEPLYTRADAEGIIKNLRGVDYLKPISITENIRAKFIDAGHLLGSSYIEITATEGSETRTIMFSGDIGNKNKPIIRNPSTVTEADYVVMESTYGDRDHGADPDYVNQLAKIIEETFAMGGNVVIPTFAVGRMQEMLYFLREIKAKGLVKCFPDFPVYVDSPLAIEATNVYNRNVEDCCDDETRAVIEQGLNPITFKGLKVSVTADESKLINRGYESKVILSASGMCEAGRIRHHLKHNLWRKESTIVFVGYQVNGTLGRLLLDGAQNVKLFNESIKVRARIVKLEGTSSHADRYALEAWAKGFTPTPKRIFITHGEDSVADAFANKLLTESGLPAVAPYNGAVYDLINNDFIFIGNTEKKVKDKNAKADSNSERFKVSEVYKGLKDALKELSGTVTSLEGHSNHDLRNLTSEIRNLIKKYGK